MKKEELEGKEKLIDENLKKNLMKVVNLLIDFVGTILFSSIVLWLVVNLFCYAFKFQIRITMLQSIALIFAWTVFYWIGGQPKK